MPKSVSDFGALGDGVTDDSAAIQSALDWLSGADQRTLTFDNATYILSSRLTLSEAASFRIHGNGAVLKAQDGRSAAGGQQILQLVECIDGVIDNLFIDGNRDNRIPEESTAYNLEVVSGALLTFDNVHSDNSTIDGWLFISLDDQDIDLAPTDMKLIHCGADNCWRNGLTLATTVRFRDYHGVYNNTNGHAPQAGVDLEPDDSTAIGNVDARFCGTEASFNASTGFQVTKINTDLKMADITASGNGEYGIIHSAGILYIDGLTAENYGSTMKSVLDITTSAGQTDISNVYLNNILKDDINCPAILAKGGGHPINLNNLTYNDSTACLMQSVGKVNARNIRAYNYQGQYYCLWPKVGPSSFNDVDIHINGPAGGLRCAGADVFFNGMNIYNPGGPAGVFFDSGAVRTIALNSRVYWDTSPPTGQKGFWFTDAPLKMDNLVAFAKGTGYPLADQVKIGP